MVAVTGSKFLTGPIFSGALFVPPAMARRLRGRLLSPALRPYSARADWPAGWVAGRALTDAANDGLLLRWEAALAELRGFRALGEDQIEAFTTRFAEAIQTRLSDDPLFEPLAVRRLDRAAIGAGEGWDATATIFPFLVRDQPRASAPFLSMTATENVYRVLDGRWGRRRIARPAWPAGGLRRTRRRADQRAAAVQQRPRDRARRGRPGRSDPTRPERSRPGRTRDRPPGPGGPDL